MICFTFVQGQNRRFRIKLASPLKDVSSVAACLEVIDVLQHLLPIETITGGSNASSSFSSTSVAGSSQTSLTGLSQETGLAINRPSSNMQRVKHLTDPTDQLLVQRRATDCGRSQLPLDNEVPCDSGRGLQSSRETPGKSQTDSSTVEIDKIGRVK